MDESRTGVIERVQEVARQHRVLSFVLVAYLALSAAELFRILLFDGPRSYEAGFHPAETVTLPRGQRTFSWTRGNGGTLLRPLHGQVVRIPLFLPRPDVLAEGLTVEISIDGRGGDLVTAYAGEWQTFDYYLPALLGADPWRDDPASMRLDHFAVLEPADAEEPFLQPRSILRRPPDYVQVFAGWRAQPGPPSVWFRFAVGSTFTPADIADEGGADQRELGVGVGELLWLAQLPADGIGLHPWEEDSGGRFAWTKNRASLRVAIGGSSRLLRLTLRPPPDPSPTPLTVSCYWNATFIETLELQPGQGLVDVELLLPDAVAGESSGILTVNPSRTWSPNRAGVSVDERELGVAIRAPEWVPRTEVNAE